MILLKQLAITRTDINFCPSELLQDWVMLFATNNYVAIYLNNKAAEQT